MRVRRTGQKRARRTRRGRYRMRKGSLLFGVLVSSFWSGWEDEEVLPPGESGGFGSMWRMFSPRACSRRSIGLLDKENECLLCCYPFGVVLCQRDEGEIILYIDLLQRAKTSHNNC